MNAGLYQTNVGRWLLTLLLAVMLAMTAWSWPLLAELAGVPVVTTTYACQGQGGGCG